MTTLNKLIQEKEKEKNEFLQECYRLGIMGFANHDISELWYWFEDILSTAIQEGYELAIKDVMELECMKEEPDDLDAFAKDSEIAVENLNRNELRETLKLQLQSLLKEKL